MRSLNPCEFPEAEFVFGVKRCGVLGEKVIVDSEGNPGIVCDRHYDLIMKAQDGARR